MAADSALFAERGLDAPLEEVARRAGVSVGTLYNHFPTREALWDAILPERLAAVDRIVETALAADDPWQGFAGFVQDLFALQAADMGLNDVLAQRYPPSPELNAACDRGLPNIARVVERAQEEKALRADFQASDLAALIWAVSQVIRESATVAPQAWRRCLAFFLDGLRAEVAHPVADPPMTPEQLAEITRRPPR